MTSGIRSMQNSKANHHSIAIYRIRHNQRQQHLNQGIYRSSVNQCQLKRRFTPFTNHSVKLWNTPESNEYKQGETRMNFETEGHSKIQRRTKSKGRDSTRTKVILEINLPYMLSFAYNQSSDTNCNDSLFWTIQIDNNTIHVRLE